MTGKQKKDPENLRVLWGGSWGSRTPDPLLVRQTLWTNWAKLPCSWNQCVSDGTAKVRTFSFAPNFSARFFKKRLSISQKRGQPELKMTTGSGGDRCHDHLQAGHSSLCNDGAAAIPKSGAEIKNRSSSKPRIKNRCCLGPGIQPNTPSRTRLK